jgi:putative nucleotidyltransferase with HDIG domain
MTDRTKIKPIVKGKPVKRSEREGAGRGKSSAVPQNGRGANPLKWGILIILSIVISLLLFPNILSKPPSYKLGDIAKRDIKATHDFLIENKALTEKDRDAAAREVLAVYDFDNTAVNAVPAIREAFETGRMSLVSPSSPSATDEQPPSEEDRAPTGNFQDDSLLKNRFFSILDIPADDDLFSQLLDYGFPDAVEENVVRLVTAVSARGIVGNRAMLKNQMEKGGIVLHEILSKRESTVTDLDRFFDLGGARQYIDKQGGALKGLMEPSQLADLSLKLAQALVAPNLTFNQRETETRKELARKSVKPVYFKIKKGEMLVREGERIGPDHLVRLSEARKSFNRPDMIGRVPAMAILIGFLFFVVYIVSLKGTKSLRGDGRDLVFSASILLSVFVFFWAYNVVAEELARGFDAFSSTALLFAMPVATGAMLISIFQGTAMAVTFSLIIAVLSSLLTGGRVEFFLYFFVSSIVAAYGVKHCHERVILIKTGLMVGLINTVLALAVEMIYGSLYSLEALTAAACGFFGGLLSGVIATGILPLIELSFGFTTDIKLLELGNLDQPLLRDLMVRAPGTYHHSVIISNMVEATAKAVQANPLLAKVSAYYHDIGKMKKPLYFVENQTGSENKHERLAPSMSSLILISHVKDGVELAKRHKLGREIIDIIQQHHGSSLISFFYQKAKDRMVTKGKKLTEIKEEDFRYPGPKPQTKEAGLVMLADMVEAASRSLVDPTPARIQGMVQKIINKAFSDGQLDECELTLKDLHEIAKSFNKTLSGIFHHRIEYPEVVARTAKKAKNGNTNHGATEGSGAKKSEDKGKTEEGLRRLGLS